MVSEKGDVNFTRFLRSQLLLCRYPDINSRVQLPLLEFPGSLTAEKPTSKLEHKKQECEQNMSLSSTWLRMLKTEGLWALGFCWLVVLVFSHSYQTALYF